MANQLDGAYPAPTYMNGNDAIVLYKNGTSTIVDIFGKMGDASMTTAYGWSDAFPYDGSAGAIWTENHTLKRKQTVKKGVTVNPDPFIVTQQWDSLPKDTWTGLGTHTCDCQPASVSELTAAPTFSMFPNPVDNGTVFVGVNNDAILVEVLDLNGKQLVAKTTANGAMVSIETAELTAGLYVVRVSTSNHTASQQKLMVK
jgi:hypothetical protein